jgi:cytoskeleton protein RodZ
LKTLGDYLKNQRESRNITLEEVAKVTKIRKTILKAIEGNRHDLLPPRVFTQGFLKIYASYLELDESEVVKRYQEALEGIQLNGAKEKGGSQKPPKKALTPARVLILFAIFVLTLAFWFFVFPQREKEIFVPESDQQKSVSKSAKSLPVTVSVMSEEKAEGEIDGEEEPDVLDEETDRSNVEEVKEVEAEKMILRVLSSEITWIKFQLDNDEPFDVLLKSGESFRVKASEKFNLRIGNAGGVELFLNDKALGNPGKRGEVVDITLPE